MAWQTSSSRTELKLSRLRHAWTICDFSYSREETGRYFSSPVFNAADGPDWVMNLYPHGATAESREYVALYLHMCSSHMDDLAHSTAQYKFSMLTNEGEEKDLPMHKPSWFKYCENSASPRVGCGCRNLIKRDDLIPLLKDDELTIYCEIIIRADRVNPSQCSARSMKQQISVPECTLSDDFGLMFNRQNLGDTIIAVDGEEFRVCRQILQARSSVFAAMFDHETLERKQNRVKIEDAKPEAVREMLYYIYTGRAPNLHSMANDLLSIADRYDLKRLKIMSEKVLAERVTNENAIETLILADLHSASVLKEFVMNFIVINKAHFSGSSIRDNDLRLSLLQHANLMFEVCKALYSPSKKNINKDSIKFSNIVPD